MALTLLLSGLPWAKSWGGLLRDVRQVYAQTTVVQDWTTGSAAERKANREANTPASDEHAQHMGMAGMDGMADMPMSMAPDYSPLDRIVPSVAALGWPAPVLISPPSKRIPSWSARSDTQDRPRRVDARVDPATGKVIAITRFEDRPFLDRLVGYGVAIHEGQLFAPLNQILGVVTALGLLTMSVSSVVLWWKRRPTGRLGAPTPHRDARMAGVLIVIVMVLGVFLPLFGASLLAVLILERLVLRRWRKGREFLGLSGGDALLAERQP